MKAPGKFTSQFMARSIPVFKWWVSEIHQMLEPLLKRIEESRSVSLLLLHEDRTELRVFNSAVEANPVVTIASPLVNLDDTQRNELLVTVTDSEVLICLSPSDVLISTITHTTATAATRESLTYRLLQESPIEVNRLIFAWRRSSKTPGPAADTDTQLVDVALCRRDRLDDVVATLRGINISPVAIGFGVSDSARLEFIFPTEGRLNATTTLKRHRNKLLLAGLILIPMMAIFGVGIFSTISARSAQQRLAALELESRASDALLRRQGMLTGIHAELAQISALPSATNVINDLSASIPLDTWLTELRLDGSSLKMSGRSTDPSQAAKSLARLPALHDIRLGSVSSPIAGSVDTQFEISASVDLKQ